jgi:hypothetical protein
MRWALLSILVLGIAAAVGAAPPQSQGERDVAQVVISIQRAIVRGDETLLERLWTDDFVNIHASGVVRKKAQFLADRRAGTTRLEHADPENIQVRVYGDTAVATYRVRAKGRIAGRELKEGVAQTMSVFVRRDGQWRAVATQYTRIQ